MKQNHEFIEALVELYEQIPDDDPALAARRVAVLVDHMFDHLEMDSIPVTRETMIYQIQKQLSKYKKSA